MQPCIVGRSSSHFTRIVRVFAHELDVQHDFRPVLDLMSQTPTEYAGNPALKVPSLETADGTWFGSLNICRELARRSATRAAIVWPEQLTACTSANAQELVLQGMTTGVALITQAIAGAQPSVTLAKQRASLERSVAWLDQHVDEVLHALPADRAFSFYEVSQFCFFTHLDFRALLDSSPYPRLTAFCRSFAQRPSAQATPYRFDAA